MRVGERRGPDRCETQSTGGGRARGRRLHGLRRGVDLLTCCRCRPAILALQCVRLANRHAQLRPARSAHPDHLRVSTSTAIMLLGRRRHSAERPGWSCKTSDYRCTSPAHRGLRGPRGRRRPGAAARPRPDPLPQSPSGSTDRVGIGRTMNGCLRRGPGGRRRLVQAEANIGAAEGVRASVRATLTPPRASRRVERVASVTPIAVRPRQGRGGRLRLMLAAQGFSTTPEHFLGDDERVVARPRHGREIGRRRR